MLKDDDKITYIFIYYYTMKARYILQRYLKRVVFIFSFFVKKIRKNSDVLVLLRAKPVYVSSQKPIQILPPLDQNKQISIG